jgi:hypothetical protein
MLGRFINWGQRLTSSDNHSVYNHCGIFLDDKGVTLEALWHVTSTKFFERYAGKQVFIVRPDAPWAKINIEVNFLKAEHFGKCYPWYGFIYMIAPPLAKYLGEGKLMCSEFVAKLLWKLGIRTMYYRGTTPDKLVDEARHWKEYKTIYEGKI